jgi:transketolase
MAPASSLVYGAYVLNSQDSPKPDLLLVASGSEVPVALEAMEKLKAKGLSARVISMPSWELFEQQPLDYRNRVFPPEIKTRLAVEAGRTQGWYRYVGDKGTVIGLDHFGASAPYQTLYEQFGLTADRVVGKALELLDVSK